jgi:hypothetical protein
MHFRLTKEEKAGTFTNDGLFAEQDMYSLSVVISNMSS